MNTETVKLQAEIGVLYMELDKLAAVKQSVLGQLQQKINELKEKEDVGNSEDKS